MNPVEGALLATSCSWFVTIVVGEECKLPPFKPLAQDLRSNFRLGGRERDKSSGE